MKIHKIEVYLLDFDEDGILEDAVNFIQSPHNIFMMVKSTQSVDVIGEWDTHKLNQRTATLEDFREHFGVEK